MTYRLIAQGSPRPVHRMFEISCARAPVHLQAAAFVELRDSPISL